MYKTTITQAKKVLHLADGNNFFISDGVNFYNVYRQDFEGLEFNTTNVKTWLKQIQGVTASPKYYLDDTLNYLSKPFNQLQAN